MSLDLLRSRIQLRGGGGVSCHYGCWPKVRVSPWCSTLRSDDLVSSVDLPILTSFYCSMTWICWVLGPPTLGIIADQKIIFPRAARGGSPWVPQRPRIRTRYGYRPGPWQASQAHPATNQQAIGENLHWVKGATQPPEPVYIGTITQWPSRFGETPWIKRHNMQLGSRYGRFAAHKVSHNTWHDWEHNTELWSQWWSGTFAIIPIDLAKSVRPLHFVLLLSGLGIMRSRYLSYFVKITQSIRCSNKTDIQILRTFATVFPCGIGHTDFRSLFNFSKCCFLRPRSIWFGVCEVVNGRRLR